MKKILIILSLLFSNIIFGQKNYNLFETTTFTSFDSIHPWLLTDKIIYSKNNIVDTIKSKPYLDSIAWCLNRHSTIMVEICLKKGATFFNEYIETNAAKTQLESLVQYLVLNNKIPKERILTCHINSGSIRVTDEDLKNSKEKKLDKTLRTIIRIVNFDYIPK